jgi:hypothetical protein
MRRAELEHIVRAAAAITDSYEIVVIGSQAILGAHPDAPAALLRSNELDVFPKDRPELADVIDAAIGEGSRFAQTFGIYAHGVALDTIIAPPGGRSGW